jgi:hypothetical protein
LEGFEKRVFLHTPWRSCEEAPFLLLLLLLLLVE